MSDNTPSSPSKVTCSKDTPPTNPSTNETPPTNLSTKDAPSNSSTIDIPLPSASVGIPARRPPNLDLNKVLGELRTDTETKNPRISRVFGRRPSDLSPSLASTASMSSGILGRSPTTSSSTASRKTSFDDPLEREMAKMGIIKKTSFSADLVPAISSSGLASARVSKKSERGLVSRELSSSAGSVGKKTSASLSREQSSSSALERELARVGLTKKTSFQVDRAPEASSSGLAGIGISKKTDRAPVSREISSSSILSLSKKTSASLSRKTSANVLERITSETSVQSKESHHSLRSAFLRKASFFEKEKEECESEDDDEDSDDSGWDFKCIGLDHDPACPDEGISRRY